MPTTVTETSAFSTPIQRPNNGEAADDASLLNTFLQFLVNRTKYLKDRLLNGIEGGTVAPTGTIIINGEGIQVAKFRSTAATSFFTENVSITENLDVGGTTSVFGLTAQGVLAALGGIAASSIIALSSVGRLRLRVVTSGVDSNMSITPQTADVYYAAAGTLTANRSWTINDASCANGDWMIIGVHNQPQSVTILAPGGGAMSPAVELAGHTSGSSGFYPFAILIRLNGTWRGFIPRPS